MEERMTLEARPRSNKTSKQLRRESIIPALIYNHGKTDHIEMDAKDINKLFASGISESTLIDLNLKGKTEVVFIKEYQLHPVTDVILHLDLYRITFGEKIKTHIAIELEGKPIGIREGGVLESFLHEVEIEIFPKYLTSSLKIDISHLKIGHSIHVRDLTPPPESKILMESNSTICQISASAKLESEVVSEQPEEQEEELEKDKEEKKAE